MVTSPDMIVYDVTWHPGHYTEERHTTRVSLHRGYSTQEDIPRIIAVARTGNPADAVLINVDHIEPVTV